MTNACKAIYNSLHELSRNVYHVCMTDILYISGLSLMRVRRRIRRILSWWTDLSSGLDSFPYGEVAGQPASQETGAQLPLDSPQLLNPSRHGQHSPPEGRKQSGHSNAGLWIAIHEHSHCYNDAYPCQMLETRVTHSHSTGREYKDQKSI